MKNLILSLALLSLIGCGSQTETLSEKKPQQQEAKMAIKKVHVLGIDFKWQEEVDSQKSWKDALLYCKQKDMRVPTPEEFFALLETNQSIDTLFPSPIKEFWTSKTYNDKQAWKISTWSSSQAYADKKKNLGVRCVSGEKLNKHTFSLKNGRVIDKAKATKIWQDDGDTKTKKVTFQEAKEYCQDKKMRLPTLFELQQTTKANFKNQAKGDFLLYWSNTPLPTDNSSMMGVNFSTGGVSFSDKDTKNHFRCIDTKPKAKEISSVLVEQNQAKNILLEAEDEDGKELSYRIVKQPIFGTISLVDDLVTYTSTINHPDNDSFTFVVNDGYVDSDEVTVTLHTHDITIPVITLIGENPQIINFSDNYIEKNATVYDEIDGNISSSIIIDSSRVNPNKIGTYTVTYDAYDSQKNKAIQITRVIKVVDTIAPKITLVGAKDITLQQNSIYKEEGATAIDNIDNNINVNQKGTVNTDIAGIYTIIYTAIDKAGNSALPIVRTITVIQKDTLFQTDTPLVNIYTSSINDGVTGLKIADFDNDGDKDILANTQDEVFWYENQGDKTFSDKKTIAQTEVHRIYASDINADGYVDVIYAKDDLTICINQQDKTFTCNQTIHSGYVADDEITSITTTDIDNDADIDILATSKEEKTVNVFINEGGDKFSYNKTISQKIESKTFSGFFGGSSSGTLTEAISIDSNDAHDIVVAGEDGIIDLYKNNLDGTFTKKAISSDKRPSSISFAQLNNTGDTEIISTTSRGELFWHTSEGIAHSISNSLSSLVSSISAVDMDDDGDLDIVTNDNSSDGKVVWFENDGTQNPNFTEHLIINAENIHLSKASDIDNDGDLDIITTDKAGHIKIYENLTPLHISLLPKTGDITDDEEGGSLHFTRDSNGIVTEHLTSLMWQDDDAMLKDIHGWEVAKSTCKNSTLGQYTDWRLPNSHELFLLAQKQDTILDAIFEQTRTNYHDSAYHSDFWTANQTKHIDFKSALEINSDTRDKFSRCVRGKELKSLLIKDDNKNLVYDKIHKLMWDDNQTTQTDEKTWQEGKEFCQNHTFQNFDDWRLPNIHELHSINTNKAFKELNNSAIWWSTTHNDNSIYTISFEGNVNLKNQTTDKALVRCVRNIQ